MPNFFVRENSAEYFLHPNRIAVWAFSAGGPMHAPFMRTRPSYVRAMLAFYAVLDSPNGPEMTDDDRQQWEKYSARANIIFPQPRLLPSTHSGCASRTRQLCAG
jgi:acetyl esterase/lipase